MFSGDKIGKINALKKKKFFFFMISKNIFSRMAFPRKSINSKLSSLNKRNLFLQKKKKKEERKGIQELRFFKR